MAGGMLVMASAVRKNPDAGLEELASIVGKCSTIDLQVSYMRPGKGEFFTAKAWLLRSGNKIAFTRMELLNQDEVIIASSSGTYLMG
jgi:acyl-coenzyme A thioesterase PaaI-like protein